MKLLSYSRCLLLLLKTVLILDGVSCFNVDWKYPVIIQNRERGRIIPSDFGASVKLVKTDSGSAWVIIGAPRGNSTIPAHQEIVEPGVIWQCSLGHSQEKCRQLEMDPPGNQMEYGGRFERLKDRGGLGGPEGMALDGKNLVTCASRPEKRDLPNSTFYMHGVCYRRPRTDIFLPPPLPIPRPPMIPLEEPENEFGKVRRNGLAGFSVHMPRTGNEIVMGAPGLYRWRGSLIQYLSKDGGESFTKSYVSDPETYDRNFIWDFNYFGYSLSSGYFLQRTKIQYAAGAPRASNFNGKVVIFRFPDNEDQPLQILKEMKGDQTGSYFGASLLALDVNGDGYDDLLVGAPRYSRRLIRSRGISIQPVDERYAESGDEGAVYLYLSNNGALILQKDYLHGKNRPKAQFGTAMTSLGDLNKDGYNDFAISAPFEDNSGAVYIYHGSETGRITEHAQVIKASEIHSALTGFGFSLAGTEDIDNNGFNDIAIGSFNSSQTVILRSKPVINVYGEIKSSLTKLPLDVKQFTIQSCVSFTGDSASNDIQLGVHLHYDTSTKPSRVQLDFSDWKGVQSQRSSYIEYIVEVSKSREICTVFNVRVTSPLEYSGAPVIFRQDIYIPDQDGTTVNVRTMSIDSNGEFTVSGDNFSSFCKTCPSIKPTQVELKLPLEVNCGDDLICQSDLHLNLFFRDISIDRGFLIGSPTLVMDVELTNLKETAIAPAVLLSWGNVELKRIPEDCSSHGRERNILTYKCQMGQLLEEGKSHSVPFEFDMSTLFLSEQTIDKVEFNASVTTVSEVIPSSETSKIVQLPLYASADPHIEGSRYLEKFNDATLTPYVVFYQDFDIGIDGPSPVAVSKVVFNIPVNLTTSDTATVVNVRGIRDSSLPLCQPTRGHFSNEAQISDDEDYDDKDYEIGGLLPIDKDVSRKSNSSFVEKDRLLLHCDSPFVSCMEVTCQMDAVLKGGAVPFVSFVMDIESAVVRNLMKTHKVSAIQVESKGRLIISDKVQVRLPPSTKLDESAAITIIEKEGFKPISKWVYTIAVIIGLVVLVSLLFCLYACGCFDKKKRGKEDTVDAAEMEPLKDEKNPKPEAEENRKRVYTNDSIDVIGPPEFIPEQPPTPTPEQAEEEVTTRPSSQELAPASTDTR